MLSNFLLQINVAGTPALNEVENVVSEEKTLSILSQLRLERQLEDAGLV